MLPFAVTLLKEMSVRKRDRIYHMSGFAVANDRGDIGAAEHEGNVQL